MAFSFSVILLVVAGLCLVKASIIGVPLEKLSFYNKGKDFGCLDGSQSIPFSYVNDDYCDCTDGSDEPGTAACSNSQFYCENKQHEPQYLMSSRVNDGICDCCDGGDEWNSDITCPNTCIAMGRKMKEELHKLQEVEEQGYQKRTEYINEGRQKKEEYNNDLSVVESDLGVVMSEVESLRQIKEEAEEPESIKKEEHQKRWEEERQLREEEMRKTAALDRFNILDTDSDNLLSVEEVMNSDQLDDDGDGTVSVEEAETYLDGNEPVSFDTFLDKSWDVMATKFKESEKEKEREEMDEEEHDDEHDDEHEDDEDDDIEEDEPLEMPPYDEGTQQLIDVAEKARQSFKEAEERKRSLENRKNDLEKYLNLGLGLEEEFSPLYDQCYEYTDREYTYKMCMFQKVTQRSKNGGRETSLGIWEKWSGSDGNQYSSMKYTKGEKCWNGPDRSTTVHLKCGVEDKIISASEPNKCEYAMDFTTPAACIGKVNAKPKIRVEL